MKDSFFITRSPWPTVLDVQIDTLGSFFQETGLSRSTDAVLAAGLHMRQSRPQSFHASARFHRLRRKMTAPRAGTGEAVNSPRRCRVIA